MADLEALQGLGWDKCGADIPLLLWKKENACSSIPISNIFTHLYDFTNVELLKLDLYVMCEFKEAHLCHIVQWDVSTEIQSHPRIPHGDGKLMLLTVFESVEFLFLQLKL